MCMSKLTISDSGTEMEASMTIKYDSGEHCTFVLHSFLTYGTTEVTETPDGDPTIQSGSSSNCQVDGAARAVTYDVTQGGVDFTLTAAGVSTTFHAISCPNSTNWVLIAGIAGGVVLFGALLLLVILYNYYEGTPTATMETPVVNAVHVPAAQPRNALVAPLLAAPLPAPTSQPAAAQSPVATPLQRLQAAEAKAAAARNYVVAGKVAVHCQALEQLEKRLNDLVAARNYSAATEADDELKTALAEAESFLCDLASDM